MHAVFCDGKQGFSTYFSVPVQLRARPLRNNWSPAKFICHTSVENEACQSKSAQKMEFRKIALIYNYFLAFPLNLSILLMFYNIFNLLAQLQTYWKWVLKNILLIGDMIKKKKKVWKPEQLRHLAPSLACFWVFRIPGMVFFIASVRAIVLWGSMMRVTITLHFSPPDRISEFTHETELLCLC